MSDRLPFDGVGVLVLGGGAASMSCARQLAGFGADVVRVEPDVEPLDRDEQVALLAGIDRVHADGDALDGLIAGAAVVVDDRSPAEALDAATLHGERPDLVITTISPFGHTGPRRDWEASNAVSFASGGIMSLTGEPNRPPLVSGGDQAVALGGLNAFAATAHALVGRTRTGYGAWIDLSLQECAAAILELYGAMSEYETGEPCQRAGNTVRAQWGIYPCADGYAGVCCLERQVPAFFELLGPAVSSDERFTDLATRPDHDEELAAHVLSFFVDRTTEELLALGPRHRVPFGAVRSPVDLLDDETYAERGFLDEIATADGMARVPGRPFPGVGWRSPEAATAPTTDIGAVIARWDRPHGGPASPAQRPLDGIRVVDLTMMWAGPFSTKLLAEQGAEVVKVESPSAWDNIRTLVPQDPDAAEPWNTAYYFNEYNHSKKSLTLDLAQPRGRELLLELVSQSDVLVESYRADVLDNLGLGADVLRSARPDLVMVTMAGFGKTGALRHHVGFGPIIEMMSGLTSLSGYGDGTPVKAGISYGDPVGGLTAAAAVAVGLARRERTGEGVHIDLSQLEAASSMIRPAFAAASLRGEHPDPIGNRHRSLAPQGCYPAAGEDRWVVVSVRDDAAWTALCAVIDRPDLSGLRVPDRRDRHDEIDEVLATWCATRAPDVAAAELQAAGVAAYAVADTRDIHDDPQLVDRGFWVASDHPLMAPYRQSGDTWRLVGPPPHRRRHSPLFGEHNREILVDLLGCTDTELADLAAAAVIADAPIDPSVG